MQWRETGLTLHDNPVRVSGVVGKRAASVGELQPVPTRRNEGISPGVKTK